VRQIGKYAFVRDYYKWRVENIKFEQWAKCLKNELSEAGVGFI
jgi:hypothetical protein